MYIRRGGGREGRREGGEEGGRRGREGGEGGGRRRMRGRGGGEEKGEGEEGAHLSPLQVLGRTSFSSWSGPHSIRLLARRMPLSLSSNNLSSR